MLRFDRKQQNSVKQLSFQKKIFLSKKKKKKKKTFKTPRERMKKTRNPLFTDLFFVAFLCVPTAYCVSAY